MKKLSIIEIRSPTLLLQALHTHSKRGSLGGAMPPGARAVALCMLLTITREVDSHGINGTIMCKRTVWGCQDEGSMTACLWARQVCLLLRAAQFEYLSADGVRAPCARVLPRTASVVC